MKILFSILLLLPLLMQGQEVISKNNKAIATRYRQIPNNFSAWTAGTGSFTTVGANLPNGYIQCTSAGTAYIESKQAYGEWYFDFYKGADVNIIYIPFISNGTLGANSNTGYTLRLNSDEAIYLRQTPAISGGYSTLSSYFSINAWYSIKITRTSAGVLTTYIRGGAFGNLWTLVTASTGTNPVTDNTYTTSNYFVIDLDAGDRIRNVRFLPLNQNKLSEIATRWRHIPNETSSFTVTEGSLSKVGTGTSAYLQAGATPTTAYFPYKQAYGTWEFDVWKQNATSMFIYFINSNSLNSGNNGYAIILGSDERLHLSRIINGVYTGWIMYSATGYLSSTPLWYSIRITRTSTGIFTAYIKGGAYGNEWTLVSTTSGYGTNPTAADNTYTTSNYFVIDLDNGDAIRNIRFKSLPLWP